MLKCERCGEYYVPGYLECRCRMTGQGAWTVNLSPTVDKAPGGVSDWGERRSRPIVHPPVIPPVNKGMAAPVS